MPELYPTYRKTLLDGHQEQLLIAMLEEWKESEMKADPTLMQETLDAIDEIVSGVYNLPQPYKTPMLKATARALARKKQAEQQEREETERRYREWMKRYNSEQKSRPLRQVLEEIEYLRTELGLNPHPIGAFSGTQKRKSPVTKKRAGSKIKRTKSK